MIYILDTDHISLIQRNNRGGKRILEKIEATENVSIEVTVITYEEQLRGRLGVISRAIEKSNAEKLNEQVNAYQGLQRLLDNYRSIQLLPFDHDAALEYQRLRKTYRRLGAMDLRIAAIAITQNATLLTRNTSDFGKIVELSIEDWSVE